MAYNVQIITLIDSLKSETRKFALKKILWDIVNVFS